MDAESGEGAKNPIPAMANSNTETIQTLAWAYFPALAAWLKFRIRLESFAIPAHEFAFRLLYRERPKHH